VQELTGGNLSAAITQALRRLIDAEGDRRAGFAEVTVKVGAGTVEQRLSVGSESRAAYLDYIVPAVGGVSFSRSRDTSGRARRTDANGASDR